ncbi:MAG: zinc ribbon domain-containing protein [Spirochaetia bacterium]|nr:zinc ribbon domain-containing protein [Spirochaetia bacterium]
MPTYVYECQSCRHVFEVVQSMSDAPIEVCTKCGKKVKRIIPNGSVGIIFKGSGFYCKDNPRSGCCGGCDKH